MLFDFRQNATRVEKYNSTQDSHELKLYLAETCTDVYCFVGTNNIKRTEKKVNVTNSVSTIPVSRYKRIVLFAVIHIHFYILYVTEHQK